MLLGPRERWNGFQAGGSLVDHNHLRNVVADGDETLVLAHVPSGGGALVALHSFGSAALVPPAPDAVNGKVFAFVGDRTHGEAPVVVQIPPEKM